MDKKRSSGIIKSATALLAVVIIIVVILLINQKRRLDEHHKMILQENINANESYDSRLDDFIKFADMQAEKEYARVEKRDNDYESYSQARYGMAHLSMWDISSLSAEQYQTFFGITAKYADYMYSTPMELKDYLTKILESGNEISHLYINIDPYILEQNYYEALRYKEDTKSFEEYIHTEIFPILDANPDLKFEFFLPARPISYWANMPINEYSEILDKWYVFLMYLHWCPNAVVRYMGDAEWLVANETNYVSYDRLRDDVMQKVYVYLYAYVEYEVNAPELKQKKGALDKYIRKELNGEYDVCDLSGKKLVFMGDSLFDYIDLDTVAVPGVVHRMTNGDCYNLAIGGTTMSAIDELGFTRVANSLAMKSTMDFDSRYKREAERFLKDYSEDDELCFIILYGVNDYFSNVPIKADEIEEPAAGEPAEESKDETVKVVYTKESTFTESLKYGLESLKKAYPDATIVVLSPYCPNTNNNGKTPFQEGGHSLTEYMKVLKDVARSEGVVFYDLYNEGTLKPSNVAEYLNGGIHTNENGAFYVAGDIARELGTLLIK